MFVFYDWPLAHVHFAKNVAYFPFNSWLSFQRLCRLLWGYSYQWMHTYLTIRAIRFFPFSEGHAKYAGSYSCAKINTQNNCKTC